MKYSDWRCNAMVFLITGNQGKGKTSYMLSTANEALKEASGNIVYVDKSSRHMYELNNKIRMIDISSFPVRNVEQFTGFICGILSQDHDIEKVFIDNFGRVAHLKADDMEGAEAAVNSLEEISRIFSVDFIIALTTEKQELSAALQEKVSKAL